MVAQATVYLTRDRSRAVPAGDKDAASLLVRAGQEIPQATAEKYEGALELIGGIKSTPKTAEKIETREPEPQHRDPKHRKH